jgi:tetratricopeptide (TPR) repeat protein
VLVPLSAVVEGTKVHLDNPTSRASFSAVSVFVVTLITALLSEPVARAQPILTNRSGAPLSPPSKSRRDAAELVEAARTTNAIVTDPVEVDYEKLLDEDDAAREEIDGWIQNNQKFAKAGAAVSDVELNHRIRGRLEPVRKDYEAFLERHPDHIRARIAYGSFLGDINDEEGEQVQLEKALKLDTNNPAIYNNLANINGHIGDVKKSFAYYEKALQLNPREPVYYHNFGTTVFLFRKDAREYYHLEEQQVFDKALALYSNAMRLDPDNFPLATDVAMTYYGIRPPRTDEALGAWTNALRLAHDELEREGVYVHFARLKLHAGRFDEARAHLAAITNEVYTDLKEKLTRNIERLEHSATNSVAGASGVPSHGSPEPGATAAQNSKAATPVDLKPTTITNAVTPPKR